MPYFIAKIKDSWKILPTNHPAYNRYHVPHETKMSALMEKLEFIDNELRHLNTNLRLTKDMIEKHEKERREIERLMGEAKD